GYFLTEDKYSSTSLSAGSLTKGNNPKTLRSSCGSECWSSNDCCNEYRQQRTEPKAFHSNLCRRVSVFLPCRQSQRRNYVVVRGRNGGLSMLVVQTLYQAKSVKIVRPAMLTRICIQIASLISIRTK